MISVKKTLVAPGARFAHPPLVDVTCPHCGESIDVYVDPGGGEVQEYVEDCSVCCRPILFHAEYAEDEGEFRVTVSDQV